MKCYFIIFHEWCCFFFVFLGSGWILDWFSKILMHCCDFDVFLWTSVACLLVLIDFDWLFVDFLGFWWLHADSVGFLFDSVWFFVDSSGFLWIWNGCLRIIWDSCGSGEFVVDLLRVLLDVGEFWIDFNSFFWVLVDSDGFWWIVNTFYLIRCAFFVDLGWCFVDFCRFLLILIDCAKLWWIFMNFDGFLLDVHEF